MRSCLGFAVAVLLLLALGCSQQAVEPRGCASHSECGAGAYCREGACASSQAPVARVTPPADRLLSHVRLRFDGSASSDPDPGDAVAAYAWSARAVAAGCEPARSSGSEAAFELLVACSGSFEVRLEVTDSHGVRSSAAVSTLDVGAQPSPPSATLSGPAALGHRCAGDPLLCSAVDEAGATHFALQAGAASPSGDAFAWRWSARPPPSLAAAPRVSFFPADGPAPTVRIETDGGPIAGDYVVTVEATDALGFVASASLTLSVTNRPPEARVTGVTLALPHAYTALPPRYTAQGSVGPFEVVDPDGDPVATRFSAEEAGVSAPTLHVTASGTSASLEVLVPGAEPASLLGPGVSRTLRATMDDGNGGTAEVAWPVVIENRAPRRAGSLAAAADHSFDAASMRYLATVPFASYVDDDGDPIFFAAPSGNAVCPGLSFLGIEARVSCALSYGGTADVDSFARSWTVSVQVSDPWEALPAQDQVITILNRPPVAGILPTPAGCRSTCCPDPETGECLNYAMSCRGGTVSYPPPVTDPDGDPLELAFTASGSYSVAPATQTCGPACEPVEVTVPAYSVSCEGDVTLTGGITVQATDGLAVAVR